MRDLEHGVSLATIGRHREALPYFEREQQIDPTNAACWFCAGVSYTALAEFQKGIACFDEALRRDDSLVEAYNNKAHCLIQLGRYTDAIEPINKGLAIRKDLPHLWRQLAHVFGRLGERDKSFKCYSTALELDPLDFATWSNVGFELAELNDFQQALAHFRKALDVNPTYAHALQGMERCHRALLQKPFVGPAQDILSIRPGARLQQGRFDVRRVIHGGMGIVYVVWDRVLRHLFALKSLTPALLLSEHRMALFISESERWIAIPRHPNVVSAYFIESILGTPFILLEYVDGPTLRTHLSHGALTPMAALDCALQIASAMAHVHDCGDPADRLIHRDLKPENILLSNTFTYKITDFGLAILAAASNDDPGGTPGYMSPEQMRGDALDATSDIYSFGVVLCEILTRRHPCSPTTPSDHSVELRKIASSLPADAGAMGKQLLSVGLHCMAYGRESRPGSFHKVRSCLEALATAGGLALPQGSVHQEGVADTVPSHLLRGVSLGHLGKHEMALGEYERGLAVDAHDATLLYNKGMALRFLGRLADALETVALAISNALDPELLGRCHIGQCALLQELGRYEEAIQSAELALAMAQKVTGGAALIADACLNKANGLRHLGRREEALRLYDKAIEWALVAEGTGDDAVTFAGATELPWYNRGSLFRELGLLVYALPDLEEALRLNPRSWITMGEKGLVLILMDRLEEGVDCVRLAATMRSSQSLISAEVPTDAQPALLWGGMEALYERTSTLEKEGRLEDALRVYDGLLALRPALSAYWTARGWCLSRLGRHSESIMCCERAIALDDKDYMPWLNKASIFYDIEDFRQALATVEEALKRRPLYAKAMELRRLCVRHLLDAEAQG